MIVSMLFDFTVLVFGVVAFILCSYTIYQTINHLQALSGSEQEQEQDTPMQPLLGVVYPESKTPTYTKKKADKK